MTATEAARNFAELLDAVEHHGERITIVRRGKAIALIEPISSGRGSEVKAVLGRHSADPDWRGELEALRELVSVEERA